MVCFPAERMPAVRDQKPEVSSQRSEVSNQKSDQPQCRNRCCIDNCGDLQAVILLISSYCRSCRAAERAADPAAVITKLLESALYVRDHLIRQQITISVNRAIVIVILVGRIVTPGRAPITRVPIIIAASDKNDGCKMAFPPTAIVPCVAVPAKSLRVTRIPLV